MNLIPVAVEQMQKVSKEELIQVVKEILPDVETDVQVELIVKLKEAIEKR